MSDMRSRYGTQQAEVLKRTLVGRRVLSVKQEVIPPSADGGQITADYVRLVLDDGSEILLLDGDGCPPMCEVDREPWGAPQVWDGDGA